MNSDYEWTVKQIEKAYNKRKNAAALEVEKKDFLSRIETCYKAVESWAKSKGVDTDNILEFRIENYGTKGAYISIEIGRFYVRVEISPYSFNPNFIQTYKCFDGNGDYDMKKTDSIGLKLSSKADYTLHREKDVGEIISNLEEIYSAFKTI